MPPQHPKLDMLAMKAAQLIQYGGKEAIKINDVPQPSAAEGEILVEVRAAGVNPFDWKVQAGYMKNSMPLQLPVTMGGDFAGIVIAVGNGVSQFKKDDEVFGQANVFAGNSGSFAEFALTKPTSIAYKPKKLNFIEAGSLPLAGVSAVQAIIEYIKLKKGQKILIHGGAGGIGSVAIQIAKHIGAYVITTVSTNDINFVKELGADEVIDYKAQKFENTVKDIDSVFDTVGGETTNRSIQVLKNGAVLVSMVNPADEELAKAKNITVVTQFTQVTTERLEKLSELVENGAIIPHLEKTFPLEEAAQALDYLKNTPPKGKIVIFV